MHRAVDPDYRARHPRPAAPFVDRPSRSSVLFALIATTVLAALAMFAVERFGI